MRALALALALAAACGGTTASPDQPGGAPAGECPASFREAAGACEPSAEACAYPEGICRCRSSYYCGGIPPRPDYQPPAPTWHCSYGPGTTRPDGCPGEKPQRGAPCSQEGQRCTYGDCCIASALCTAGRWEVGQETCPP